jgi:hypothetical protein
MEEFERPTAPLPSTLQGRIAFHNLQDRPRGLDKMRQSILADTDFIKQDMQ